MANVRPPSLLKSTTLRAAVDCLDIQSDSGEEKKPVPVLVNSCTGQSTLIALVLAITSMYPFPLKSAVAKRTS